MHTFELFQIKSFKHDGHMHRTWFENWLVPDWALDPEHKRESMLVLINNQTRIVEASGQNWVSKVPAVSFFIPDKWYNVIALLEDTGIRYYCNIASPPYVHDRVLTYIDYDLDVILTPDGEAHIVDEGEYARHKALFHYSEAVDAKVKDGLNHLLDRIGNRFAPFNDDLVGQYFQLWKKDLRKA